jgi:Family of unknown function (DUF6662)
MKVSKMSVKLFTFQLALALVLLATVAQADSRRFAWSYETTTAPKGSGEYEQWVTWKTDKDSDSDYNRLEFRQEFEYGLTDRLQLGFYFANWRYTKTASGSDTVVRSSSMELIYNLTDPGSSALGSALYGEIALGQDILKFEGKLLLEKHAGSLVYVSNTILEAEWEDANWVTKKGEFAQTLGASYQVSPKLMFGMEMLYEIEMDDWSDAEDPLLFIGPNATYRSRHWWITTSPLYQLTSVESATNLQWRVLLGFPF